LLFRGGTSPRGDSIAARNELVTELVMHYYRMRDKFAQKAMRQFAAGLVEPDSATQSDEHTNLQTP
jgi:hypothetical protein